jgi:hypothetical protein
LLTIFTSQNFTCFFTNHFRFKITTWGRVLEKLTVAHLVQKYLPSVEPDNSVTCSPCWARLIRSTPSKLIYGRSILILSSHLRLCYQNYVFFSIRRE